MRSFRSLCALALSALAACGAPSSGKAPGGKAKKPAAPVVVAVAQRADLPVEVRAVGNVEPVRSIAVRAQTGGILTEVRLREGDRVAAGQLLFQIDPRTAEATIRQLQANLARDEAQVRNVEAQVRTAEAQARNAEAQAKRYEGLVAKDFVTREQYEDRRTEVEATRAAEAAGRAAVDAARAAAESTRAAIENARLQLGYATVRSPLSGVAGSLGVKQGDLIKGNDAAALVVVNQIDPILVRFTVPEDVLPEVQKYRKQGSLKVRVTPPGSDAVRHGRLTFVDNGVDPATGTIALKAEFANADAELWPGQFVEVSLVLYTRTGAVVVPGAAIQTGQQGTYVFTVSRDGTADLRPVRVGLASGGRTAVEEGLEAGETVVTDGQLRLTPGAKVVLAGGEPGAAPLKGGKAP